MSEDSASPARNIGIIRLRLPYIDSRALSQAWFSALHRASDAKPASPLRRVKQSVSGERVAAAAGSEAAERPTPAAPKGALRVRRRDLEAIGGAERSSPSRPRPKLPAPMQLTARSYPPVQASFSFGLDGARVQVLVRRDGPTLHVLALCAPRHVDLIRRALACADLHLRARGEALRSAVRAAGSDEVFA
jgi:hypothetical protein